jgi:DNA-binding beta-propeller fold protein YncE
MSAQLEQKETLMQLTKGRKFVYRCAALMALMALINVASIRLRADTGTCGGQMITLPFTDVMGNTFFCQIAAAYFSGLTNGTSANAYSPSQNVTRAQMAAFVTRTLDQTLRRGSRRAALRQFWTTRTGNNLALTTVGENPLQVKSDGTDLWVANSVSDTVSRVRASDGKLLQTRTGTASPLGVLVAKGMVFVTGNTNPGRLYQIDPTDSAAATTLSSNLPGGPKGIAYDGQRIWTRNSNSISIITLNPINIINVTGLSAPSGILYDGSNIWITDEDDGTLKKLDATGTAILTVDLGATAAPRSPTFDGTNIWVANQGDDTMAVVRATGALAGTVLARLSGNGLDTPAGTAFDGERILVANTDGESVSLWRASDFTPIGTFSTGAGSDPFGVCSDGLNFWITVRFSSLPDCLARF